MIDLINDLSILTDVSDKTLNKFVPVSNYCIGHAVHESQCKHEDVVEIDIGIGELHLKLEDGCGIKYRFVPSKELESILIKTVTSKTSPIITKIDSQLQEKIDRAYKDLL